MDLQNKTSIIAVNQSSIRREKKDESSSNSLVIIDAIESPPIPKVKNDNG